MLLSAGEALRTREKSLHESSEAQRRELGAETERLRRERLLIDERIANSLRAHELAAQQANDDRMRERRDAEQAYQHRLLQLQREEAAVREARAMAQQERARVADELARNMLTREQRDEATAALRDAQEQLAHLKVEVGLMHTKNKVRGGAVPRPGTDARLAAPYQHPSHPGWATAPRLAESPPPARPVHGPPT